MWDFTIIIKDDRMPISTYTNLKVEEEEENKKLRPNILRHTFTKKGEIYSNMYIKKKTIDKISLAKENMEKRETEETYLLSDLLLLE